MKLSYASPVIMLLSSGNSTSYMNFNSWTQQYGTTTIVTPTTAILLFTPPGSLIYGPPQSQGTFCLNVQPPQTSGVALTMSLTSPADAAHHHNDAEIVWYSSQSGNKEVTLNLWNSSMENQIKNDIITVPNSINATYCMTWAIGDNVIWYIDGIQIMNQSIAAFTQPLSPTLTTWGALNDPWFVSVGGTYVPNKNPVVAAVLTQAYLSNKQEIIPIPLVFPSLQPTFAPSNSPVSTTKVPFNSPNVPTTTPSNIQDPIALQVQPDQSSNLIGIIVGVVLSVVLLLLVTGYAYYKYRHNVLKAQKEPMNLNAPQHLSSGTRVDASDMKRDCTPTMSPVSPADTNVRRRFSMNSGITEELQV